MSRREWLKLLSWVPKELPEGDVLGGRYVIESRLGDGAMGSVYRARHVKFGRRFAVKVLHKSLMDNAKVMKRFEREAQLAGRLRHTNVASVVDVGKTHDGQHYMVMEFAPGENLTSLLIADGPMAETRVLDLTKQMCLGLSHAHDVGLIHRDFKPDNVIVEQLHGGRETARIVDWGVAILREDAEDTDGDRLTTKGIVVGTPHYMAPEQARGGAIDHRVDIFALGLIMYELLTGKLPFEGSGVDVARANLEQTPPAMNIRVPGLDVDPVMEGIVLRLLEKDPDARPQNANEVRELLDLYERDRANCALALGVKLPIEEARTSEHAIIEPPPEEPAPVRAHSPSQNKNGDPERERPTDELRPSDRRRLLLIALVFLFAFGLLLWLGLRGDDNKQTPVATAPVVEEGASDAGAGSIVAVAVQDAAVEETPLPEPEPLEGRARSDGGVPKAPVKKPLPNTGSATPAPQATSALDAAGVAKLYGAVGRELKALDQQKGMDATIDLWPRYRWIRINEWIATAERRAQITDDLERLRVDIRAANR